MRRTLVALTLVVLAAWSPAYGQTTTAEPPRPPLKAALAACQTGATEDERFAVFTGSMPAYRGTKRMAMRFQLVTRLHGSRRWDAVRHLGRWVRSEPDRAGLLWTKRVERLPQGADYRVVVRFRWYQDDGTRRTDRFRTSPVCAQPDQRPNLRIVDLDVLPGADADTSRYVLTVENAGRSAAGAFDVGAVTGLDLDTEVGERTIAALPAGEQATVELGGPACRVRAVVRADLDRVVDETNERDNRFEAAC